MAGLSKFFLPQLLLHRIRHAKRLSHWECSLHNVTGVLLIIKICAALLSIRQNHPLGFVLKSYDLQQPPVGFPTLTTEIALSINYAYGLLLGLNYGVGTRS